MNLLKSYFKKIRYLLEAGVTWLFLDFFRILKVESASRVAANISKFIGKKLSVHKLAYNNLSKAIPNLSEKEKETILDGMWSNLGRIIGEFYFVASMPMDKLDQFLEADDATKARILDLKNSGKGGIIFSAHIGNWEIGPKFLKRCGLEASTVYRPLNNPYVEKMTAKLRQTDMIEKTSAGSRKIIDVVRKGGFVIILADQKISEGEPIEFFHDKAITTTSIARIALKYDVPMIPARIIREGDGFKFRGEVEKSLVIEKTDDVNLDVIAATKQINKKLEDWIREYPSQWFWVHNRWKK
jgi:KDO2-lipid IV(A) lauroyltransferase